MRYLSTRGKTAPVNSAQAVLQGLAGDRGLFMPEKLPEIDIEACLKGSTQDMAETILTAFLPDIPDMKNLVRRGYAGKFETEDLTPLVQAGPFHVLELFRGPTSAFKDVALSMLPQLLTAARKVCGVEEEILILTATSGDTGKAALEGFCDVPGTRICVFYPHNGVSAVQRAQMVTQKGRNVNVCAVRGNFDDAQTGVKNIFTVCREQNLLKGSPFRLSSANSINIGRLVPQLTYYFKAYRDLLEAGTVRMGDPVNFSVPTGNFGDILAGYLAKCLGLPVGKLICASNANCVLTEFISSGVYDRRRKLLKTLSPSMDILVSSNLERLLYLLSGGDTALVSGLMNQLEQEGIYRIPEELLKKVQDTFRADFCTDEKTEKVIAEVYGNTGYLCDPHTAAGWSAAEAYAAQTGDRTPMVVLSTASPYKFPAAVLDALGGDRTGDEFSQMERLHDRTGVPVPANLADLRGREERFSDVIDPDQMLGYVLGLQKGREI